MAAIALGVGAAVPAGAGPGTPGQPHPESAEAPAEAHGPRPVARDDAAAPGDATVAPFAVAATNLTYSTVEPCRTFDSRLIGGPFGRGDGYFLNLTAPCGLPTDGSVKAVMANVISVNATGSGYVRVAAYDPSSQTADATVLNFNNGLISSNAVPLPVCDVTTTTCDWDTDLWIPAQATSNIVIDVLGYFS